MVESSVGLPPDSTGKKLRSTEVTTTQGTVEQQVVNVGDPATSANLLAVNADGSISVRNRDGAGSAITSTAAGTKQPLDVNLAASGSALAQTAGTITAAAANTPGVAVIASSTGEVVAGVSLAGNVTFHLVTAAFVGTLIFEASVDGGLNYSPIYCTREDGAGSETGTTVSVAAAFIRQYTAALPGLAYFRVRCSAFTSGTVAVLLAPGAFLMEPNPSLAASAALVGAVSPNDSQKTTYVATSTALSANLASDIFTLVGSATKTVKISRVEVSVAGGGTITAAQANVQLILRTAANTAGTTAAATITRLDQNDAANTATAVGYTAAATGLGAGVTIRRQPYLQAAVGTTTAPPVWVWDFGNRPEKCPTLRGITQLFAINNSAAATGTSPTLTWSISVEFTEE